MTERNSANLPWLDRLAMSVPGYGGYRVGRDRRSAAFALRDVLARRLSAVQDAIEGALKSCHEHEVLSECHALERLAAHLDRILDRVHGLGTRLPSFYEGPDLDESTVEPVYAIEHAILEQADRIADRFERPNREHDMLAEVEADLKALENRLDERALLLRRVT